jgi:hypothetical protein
MPCLPEAVGDAVWRRQGLVRLPIGSLSLGSWGPCLSVVVRSVGTAAACFWLINTGTTICWRRRAGNSIDFEQENVVYVYSPYGLMEKKTLFFLCQFFDFCLTLQPLLTVI